MNRLMANGWRPDTPDFRDRKYAAIKPKISPAKLPTSVSLRSGMPPIIDQEELGCCVGASIASALMYNRMKSKETPEFRPSMMYIYYNARLVEGTINEDAGAEIRTGIKVVNKYGFCSERNWPFVPAKYKQKPPAKAYLAGTLYKAAEYYRMDNSKINDLKTCIASGYPFVFGYQTYESGEAADKNGGKYPMPKTTERSMGGHASVICGYDDSTKMFQIHNSWGTEVADKGYYYIPYDYITNTELSDDFWFIKKIQEIDNE